MATLEIAHNPVNTGHFAPGAYGDPSAAEAKRLARVTTDYAIIDRGQLRTFETFDELWDDAHGTGYERINGVWKSFEF